MKKEIINTNTDGLETPPSDWSSIGSDNDSDSSIIELNEHEFAFENNIDIHINENSIQNTKSNNSPNNSPIKKNNVEINNVEVNNLEVNNIIVEGPKRVSPEIEEKSSPIKFYDPSSIPKRHFTSPISNKYCNTCYTYNPDYIWNTFNETHNSSKKYSWYMEYLIKIQEWFKYQTYFKVPDWVKKYF